MAWASELGAFAKSNNRQQRHRQLQWTQLKPSPIAIDAINAIIMRRRSTHKTSLSNATRKAMAISLKATRRPCQQTRQERCESVVSITAILIPQQQFLSQEHQLLQRKCDRCKKKILNARNLRQIGRIHAPDLPWQMWDQQQNSKKELASRAKKRIKNEAGMTRTPCVMRNDRCISRKSSCLAEPVTPSLVTTEQARATTTITTILLVIQK